MKLVDLVSLCDGLYLMRDQKFSGLAYLGHEPRSQSELIFLGDRKFLPNLLWRKGVAGVITTKDISADLPDGLGVLIHEEPMKAFYAIHEKFIEQGVFYRQPKPNQIHPSARIHPRAVIAEHSIHIGRNVIIGPNVILHSQTTIGDNSIIRDGSVIGGEGFEYKKINNYLVPITHAGGVEIGPDCEVQALCTIDRGLFGGDTKIGKNSKLASLVHIAHGVVIGESCLITAGSVIAGAVTVANNVRMDPNCSIGHEVFIGDGAYVSMGAVVGVNVAPARRVTGNLAIEHSAFLNFWSDAYKSILARQMLKQKIK
jgi:UDP-3-O-[3-hydroxymyristoyl] glucosamine N-acyltransferase